MVQSITLRSSTIRADRDIGTSAGSKRYMELYWDAMCESIWNSMHKD
jgi:hypothetical protein